ncbi:transcription elongation factor SPT5-like [Trichosurus vulpecula]|uniref:transcription elongation factor SPT5-like n=1 Tax=Trichosurus vulpecula TaxID=9337 RepID=UPI00186ABF4E|nr:transcription elongation factor SPT5-like [Trichosurus vulpecula]
MSQRGNRLSESSSEDETQQAQDPAVWTAVPAAARESEQLELSGSESESESESESGSGSRSGSGSGSGSGSESESEESGSESDSSSSQTVSQSEEGRNGEEVEKEDEEEEEEEEGEEEEDEDEDEDSHPRKKPKHQGFILDEAEVDDDYEEEEEEWEEGAEDFLDRERLDGSSAGFGNGEEDCSRARRLQNAWRDEGEDELSRYYMEKYATESCREAPSRASEQLLEDISQQSLLPGIRDPRLWMVKCKLGEERAAALTLMRKFMVSQFTNSPLQIKSVVAPEYLKGYIYVEAYKPSHVVEAMEGVASLRQGCQHQKLVPMQEMTDVLKVLVKEAPSLQPKSWVRVRAGLYKDDIAQVTFAEPGQATVSLKMIPRIDYSLITSPSKQKDAFAKRKRFSRPPQKLFDAQKIQSLGGKVGADGDFLTFKGNRYSHRGFLFKTFALSAVIREGVKPTLSELQKFEEQPDALQDLPVRIEDSRDAERTFTPGDKVRVVDGELVNLRGQVVSVHGPKVILMPKHEQLTDLLELSAWELQKDFDAGDHVKVISGRFLGTTGFVLRVEDNFILLLSHLAREELKVLPRDLQLCQDTALPVDVWGQHRWAQLVQLHPGMVGVIVGLDADTLQVLNMHDKVVTVRRQAVTAKKDNHLAVALDRQQNSIRVKDSVRVVDGPHSGLEAEILHLFRGSAFLHSRKLTENGGLFVCKSRHLLLTGAPQSAPGNDFLVRDLDPGRSPHVASPRHPSTRGQRQRGQGQGQGSGQGSERGRGYGHRDKGLIGQSVRICQGPYKGYIGIVKDVTEDIFRVELHSTCQTISVHPQRLVPLGTTRPGLSTPGSQTPAYGSGSFPCLYGSQTPVYEGSYTPSHTGAWDASNRNTPSRP